MSQNLISRLKSNMDYLSSAERKIANLIINNPRKFTRYSMTELSKLADVSQGSIINFSKKFSGGGYPVLKMHVAGCINDSEKPFSTVHSEDSLKDAIAKTIKNNNDAFHITAEINSESTLKAVADKIKSARKVEIYGIFRSAAVATDFCYQLLEIGIPASFVSDILTCAVSATMLDENSLVIAISSSGKTKDTLDAVKNAKANGVPVVGITSNSNSPLARLSDYPLIASSSGNSVIGKEMEVRASQLLITDAICSYLRCNMDEEGQKQYHKLKDILNSHSVND